MRKMCARGLGRGGIGGELRADFSRRTAEEAGRDEAELIQRVIVQRLRLGAVGHGKVFFLFIALV